MDLTGLTGTIGLAVYTGQAIIALWGAYCVATVWRRVADTRFRSEEEQDQLLDQVELRVSRHDFDGAKELCHGDRRAIPQLALLAIDKRSVGYGKIRHLLADRFQRDVLADLEYRLSWVNTVIKSAPMLGLFGTVVGMMGAFAKIADGQNVETSRLATDISLALVTTAVGLATAIPLIICVASINVRIRKMEDLVSAGLSRFLDVFRVANPGAAERG